MKYDWKDAGEEWSEPWGSSAAQWTETILPRIRNCLPANTILEIGPGYGRWTHYLKDYCQRLIIVDRAVRCIEACRQRFADDPRITGYVNEGGSLDMAADASIDFVFSFDVFVHIRRDIVAAYLQQLATKLKNGGKGFIHHSNLGRFAGSLQYRVPGPLRGFLTRIHIFDDDRHRTPTMTAELFRQLCAEAGLHCYKQELINWRGRRLIDCLSWIERTDTPNDRPLEIIRNRRFMREAAATKRRTEAK